jgi:hypothetical protein
MFPRHPIQDVELLSGYLGPVCWQVVEWPHQARCQKGLDISFSGMHFVSLYVHYILHNANLKLTDSNHLKLENENLMFCGVRTLLSTTRSTQTFL